MTFIADLHIHSRYSLATSREGDLWHLCWWARRKGISVVGTGDFTHPAWRAELRDQLVPAEPGLFRLRDEPPVPPAAGQPLDGPVRFLLTVEISTIYKRDGKTRKVHHVVLVPDLASADRLAARLARVGNIASDGRPILGLDSRHLLEMVLECGPGAYLIPAHIWTPWFSVLGSKSGFDSIEECYGELSSHIFALETGLSSDPAMNWRLSGLDRYRLVSNSDAHSPGKLGREANLFDCEMDYYAIRSALETGRGFAGTLEFFPEEGKYHLDGHRKCNRRMEPTETIAAGGRCPDCGGPITVGVMARVEELADRAEATRPAGAPGFSSLIQLHEVLEETLGGKGKKLEREYESVLTGLGPELWVLREAPLAEVRRVGGDALAEAIGRMRRGEVIREAGYDGEYGVIRLFRPGELKRGAMLFELPAGEVMPRAGSAPLAASGAGPVIAKKKNVLTRSAAPAPVAPEVGAGLDPDQQAAVECRPGPVLIVAGPGAGKTRVLAHRLAAAVTAGADPAACLALTFSRRAAAELRERLAALLPGPVLPAALTFHALGLEILRSAPSAAGLPPDFRVATPEELMEDARAATGLSPKKAAKWLQDLSARGRQGCCPREELDEAAARFAELKRRRGLVTFDDLICLPARIFESDPDLLKHWRGRFTHAAIDEYQDIDAAQYRLVQFLFPPTANLCAIGDPDQAIYGFRGASPAYFERFVEDRPGARVFRLDRNYRSGGAIVAGSLQALGRAADEPPEAGRIVIRPAPTAAAEAESIVESIEKLIGGKSFFSFDSGRAEAGDGLDLSFGDFGVLYRTAAQAGPIVSALARSGIPFQSRTHDRLVDAPGVAEVLAAMPFSINDGGAPVVELLAAAARQVSAAVADAASVAELLAPLATDCGADLARFRSRVALAAEADAWDNRADRVSLLTLHAAKGLEFRVVFIAGCEDGLIPLRFGGRTDLAEERRLFYVGMTRARDLLVLSHAARRALRGETRAMKPSPFLTAIEERLLARERSGGRGGPKSRQLDLF